MATHDDASASSAGGLPLPGLVRALRERVLLTQEELAHRSGLSVGTVRGLEAGRIRRPRSATVRGLADALGLSDQDRNALAAAARGQRFESDGLQSRDPAVDHTTPQQGVAGRSPPSQLPPAIADFTGREDHVVRLEQILHGDQVDASRAVVISAVAGRAGVGKTTLAVHVAHRLTEAFPDGQLYVNLGGGQADPVDPAQALARFLRAFGVDESSLPDDLDERVELYRGRITGCRCLVVLDNAASEAQVRPLLPGSPSAAVLVTSRQRLAGLEGTQPVDLDVFEPDQAVELLAKIAGRDRVLAEPDAAQQVARLCGYLPLAVRIAGARLAARPHWRIARLVERLADERRRLDELVVGDLEVRASIGLSYLGLDDDTRRAFRLIGLLEAPDFAAWVVAALVDSTVGEAAELVDSLVATQLVEVAGVDVAGHTRYRLHDLIRLYARERANDEEPEDQRKAALVRALGAWLALAEQADEKMPSRYFGRIQTDAPRWRPDDRTVRSLLDDPIAWFEAERPALVAAVGQACALGLVELAWQLAGSAHVFFDWRSFLDDWEHTHLLALACCRRTNNALGRAVMARNLTDLCEQRGRDRLIFSADEALAASREIGHRQLEAESLIQRGVLHRHDDPAAGRASIDAGLALADAVGHVPGSIAGRLWLGIMHYEAGEHEAAASRAEGLLELARRHHHAGGQFQALRLLGVSRREQGLYLESEQSFTEALDVIRTIGNRTEETRVLTSLGELYVRCGRAEARPTLERSQELASDIGDDFGKAFALRVLGELDLLEHRYDTALVHLEPALDYNRQIGLAHPEARTLRALGEAHAGRGDPESARSAWEEARRLFVRLGNTGEAEALSQRLARLVDQPEVPAPTAPGPATDA